MNKIDSFRSGLIITGAATVLGGCFQQAGENQPSARAVEAGPTITLTPTQTETLPPTSSPEPSLPPNQEQGLIAVSTAQEPTEESLIATATATAADSLPIAPSPIATVAVQNDVVHPNEANWNNVYAEPETSQSRNTNLKNAWGKVIDVLRQSGDQGKYTGDSAYTTLTNEPAKKDGKWDYTNNSLSSDPQKEIGLGHTLENASKYLSLVDVLSTNPLMLDLYQLQKDNQRIVGGMLGYADDAYAASAVNAAVIVFLSHEKDIGPYARLNDVLTDPRFQKQLKEAQETFLSKWRIKELGTSPEEQARLEAQDSEDASFLLHTINPDLNGGDEFTTCRVTRIQKSDRYDQPQTLLLIKYDRFGKPEKPTHLNTNRKFAYVFSADSTDPENNFGGDVADFDWTKAIYTPTDPSELVTPFPDEQDAPVYFLRICALEAPATAVPLIQATATQGESSSGTSLPPETTPRPGETLQPTEVAPTLAATNIPPATVTPVSGEPTEVTHNEEFTPTPGIPVVRTEQPVPTVEEGF